MDAYLYTIGLACNLLKALHTVSLAPGSLPNSARRWDRGQPGLTNMLYFLATSEDNFVEAFIQLGTGTFAPLVPFTSNPR